MQAQHQLGRRLAPSAGRPLTRPIEHTPWPDHHPHPCLRHLKHKNRVYCGFICGPGFRWTYIGFACADDCNIIKPPGQVAAHAPVQKRAFQLIFPSSSETRTKVQVTSNPSIAQAQKVLGAHSMHRQHEMQRSSLVLPEAPAICIRTLLLEPEQSARQCQHLSSKHWDVPPYTNSP